MPNNASNNRFDLRFRMTVQDLQAFQYLAHKGSGWGTRTYWGLAAASYWLIVALAALPFILHSPLRNAVIGATGFYGPPLILFAIAVALMVFHGRILVPAMLREALDSYFGSNEIHVTATDDGVVFNCGAVTTNIPWDAVERVTDAYGCIFIFTGRRNGVTLPHRAFATSKEAASFLAFARDKTKASK